MTTEILTVEEPQINFIRKKHDLQSTFKLIEKGSDKAIEMLIAAISDPALDPKFKAQISLEYLTLMMAMSDTISKDNIARQVAQVKLGGPQVTNLKTVDNTPTLNFSTISSV